MSILTIVLAGLLAQNAATVEGIVTKTGTSEPVSKAIVELRKDGDDSLQYTVAAGNDGSYAFRSVTPGRYRVAASRSGYIRVEYGQRSSSKRGTPIEVAAAQSVTGVQLVMTPTGAIYGRVYSPNGQPVVKATVRALKTSYQNGQRVLTAQQTTLSNDLGEYRLFWLAPGQYFIGVTAPNWGALGDQVTINSAAAIAGGAIQGMSFGGLPPGSDPLAPVRSPGQGLSTRDGERFMPVYFPNTTDDQAAEPIDVRPEASLGGVDIMLSPVRTRHVRGVVIDSETGKPFVNLTPGYAYSIRTTPLTDGSSSVVNAQTGVFDVQVVSGPVTLTVVGPSRTGTISIPTGDTNIDGVQIVVGTGITLTGQVMFDGVDVAANDPRVTSLRASIRADAGAFTIGPPAESGVPSRAGAFTIQNVTPGNYRINVAPILNLAAAPALPQALQNLYVKSIQLNGVDVLNQGLQIGDRQPDRPLVIVVGTNPGSIAGTAISERQEPLADVMVVLVPNSEQRQRSDLFKSATSDSMGQFKFERIPPGDYKLFAWDDVENDAWLDSQFMRLHEDRGTPVQVGEGSKVDTRVSVIPR